MPIEITHIAKPSPHDPFTRIQEVGAMFGGHVLWRLTVDEAVYQIEVKREQYYVSRGGYWIPVAVVTGGLLGRPYLRTKPDGTGVDNLLSLPQLPSRTGLPGSLGTSPTNALLRGALGRGL